MGAAADPEEQTRRLAAESLADDDPTGWFERLYAAAQDGAAVVPWDRGRPHSLLVEWAQTRRPDGAGRRALVVGCGLGRDAEYVAGLGFDTVAFDVSATAIDVARRRHPDSTVDYRTADLLCLPPLWHTAFDLVVESMTVQALPEEYHRAAIDHIGQTVGDGGTLLVIAAGRDIQKEGVDGPPWPLTREEIDAFGADGLRAVSVEDLPDRDAPGVRRWRAEFRRGQAP